MMQKKNPTHIDKIGNVNFVEAGAGYTSVVLFSRWQYLIKIKEDYSWITPAIIHKDASPY